MYWQHNLAAFEREKAIIEESDNAKAVHLIDGKPPQEGDVFRNPDLAATLSKIAESARDAYYKREIAHTIDAYFKRIDRRQVAGCETVNVVLPLLFALIAAVGNAMFALGQKQSSSVENGLLFVGVSAFLAFGLSVLSSPLVGPVDVRALFRGNWKALGLSGVGLYLTYIGFNLLYSRFGASQYVLYASVSIITTTVVVGFLYLGEPMNTYHVVAILLAIAAVALFSVGQSTL
jgi:hypothetical protein